MIKLHLSPDAKSDLHDIRKYISEKLNNPAAAQRTVTSITKKVRQLPDFPLIGSPLSARHKDAGEYRYLVCGSYLVFYQAENDTIFVDRILYGKRDYVNIIFGALSEDDSGQSQ